MTKEEVILNSLSRKMEVIDSNFAAMQRYLMEEQKLLTKKIDKLEIKVQQLNLELQSIHNRTFV